jgi:3-methyladenine DNA glycosylase AlkD
MTLEDALAALNALMTPDMILDADHGVARNQAKPDIPMAQLDALARGWRKDLDIGARLTLGTALWETAAPAARILAAKLLTQARIKPDDSATWQQITVWLAECDNIVLSDVVCVAGSKRLLADPSRLDDVESWLEAPQVLVRRAALVMTLPWSKLPFPKPADLDVRDRVLGWAALIAPQKDARLQNAVATFVREVSKHDPARAILWLEAHGAPLKDSARGAAGRLLHTNF